MEMIRGRGRTLYFDLRSFAREEDMILRRTEEGAPKCSLRLLRRDVERATNLTAKVSNRSTIPITDEDPVQ